VILETICLFASVSALALSIAALRAPARANGEALRAFKVLESDFEELSDRMATALGRVSRLKRDILQKGPLGDERQESTPPQNGGKDAAPVSRLSRSQLLARCRQGLGGDLYGHVEDSSSTTGG
jgi:hypothetical protein